MAPLSKNYWRKRNYWEKVKALGAEKQKQQGKPHKPMTEEQRVARGYVILRAENTPCESCGRLSHHGRRPLGWYPFDGERTRIPALVRKGASIAAIELEMRECWALCRSCKRKRGKSHVQA